MQLLNTSINFEKIQKKENNDEVQIKINITPKEDEDRIYKIDDNGDPIAF